VGDVVGSGVEAAVLSAELRAVFDDRVRDGGDLGVALGALDARARRTPEARATTMCVAVLDPGDGDLTYCTAGHPPPVVVGSDGHAAYLPASGAGPLGVDGGFPTATHRLTEGDVVLLYSDGLLTHPGRTVAQSSVELLQVAAEAVATAAGTDPDERPAARVCREALEGLVRGPGCSDDVAVVALQRVAPVAPLHVVLPAVPDAARTARADLADWMAQLPVGALDELSIRHAVGELVANALEHAYDDPGVRDEVRMTVRLDPDGVLEAEVADDGRWRERPATTPTPDERGRGLALVRGFVDEFRIWHDGSGTRAVVRHRLSRPAAMVRGVPAAPAPHWSTFGLDVDGTTLSPRGDLGREAAAELRRTLDRASRGGTRAVVVDLSEVGLLSSSAVQVLVEARAAGDVCLVAPVGSPAQHVLEQVRVPYDFSL
jgi:anti-sigma regulatory factor (Ser/Thr protein kinase)/ABC-type transporter Mla MlaB component